MRKMFVLTTVAAFALAACATDEYGNPRPLTYGERGAIIGAISGAVVGGLASKSKKEKGVLLGAVGGGIAGALVGSYMDNQKKDLEKALASERAAGAVSVEKLQDHVLVVTMTNQTAFEVDSASIKSGFHPSMDKIAEVLNRYGKTHLTIAGHTDSTGSDAHNQALSERRAHAVENYFRNRGVVPQRLAAYGKGESQPRASNATAQGRQLNRRVEIIIEPIVQERA